jgi:hypothetical protein
MNGRQEEQAIPKNISEHIGGSVSDPVHREATRFPLGSYPGLCTYPLNSPRSSQKTNTKVDRAANSLGLWVSWRGAIIFCDSAQTSSMLEVAKTIKQWPTKSKVNLANIGCKRRWGPPTNIVDKHCSNTIDLFLMSSSSPPLLFWSSSSSPSTLCDQGAGREANLEQN